MSKITNGGLTSSVGVKGLKNTRQLR